MVSQQSIYLLQHRLIATARCLIIVIRLLSTNYRLVNTLIAKMSHPVIPENLSPIISLPPLRSRQLAPQRQTGTKSATCARARSEFCARICVFRCAPTQVTTTPVAAAPCTVTALKSADASQQTLLSKFSSTHPPFPHTLARAGANDDDYFFMLTAMHFNLYRNAAQI